MHTKIDNIINNYCYTELVYGRINKKLQTTLNNEEIEKLIHACITSKNTQIEKIGKNYYVSNYDFNMSITINSFTYRIITVNKL